MSSYFYQLQMFIESDAGKQCIEYLKAIENTEIERSEADRIKSKYSMLFYNETGFKKLMAVVKNTYIPIVLFKEYNITVVENKTKQDINISYNNTQSNNTNNRKTAPTLVEGWLTYILIMIVLSIFYERVLGWIVTTIIFFIWRSKEIDKYN